MSNEVIGEASGEVLGEEGQEFDQEAFLAGLSWLERIHFEEAAAFYAGLQVQTTLMWTTAKSGKNQALKLMPAKKKQNYTKSKTNKVISGVIGGFGELSDVDPVLLRAGFILATAFTGFFPGLIAYALLAVIVPEKS